MYKNVTILRDQTLGEGSYGAVYKARCEHLICAAKILHPTAETVDPHDPGAGRILKRFQQECDFLHQIRHPNIVQYLGMCVDPESNLPVLLMELLDSSLAKMLESSKYPLPYCIEVDLSHDVALAVAYLHSNGIIHCNLSGNNVLVIAGRRAKVTDFGMSKLAGSNPRKTSHTQCPGSLKYMPPEALQKPPRYTEKLDIFSEGVIMIQVCTRLPPEPGPAVKETKDAGSPTGTTQVPVPETERRKKHIDLIEPTHPLLSIANACLEYNENDRLSAGELCQRLAALKDKPKYVESRQLLTELYSPEVTNASQKEQSNYLVRPSKNISAARESFRFFQLKEKDKKIEEYEKALKDLKETNRKLHSQVRQLKHKSKSRSINSSQVEIKLEWKDGKKAPFIDCRQSSVVNHNVAYFSSDENVYSYDSSLQTHLRWSTLPQCLQKWGSLTMVQGLLTMVGGVLTSTSEITNKLVTFQTKDKNEDRGWVVKFPPMPTSRRNSTATTYLNWLIIAGGFPVLLFKDYGNLDTVEVLNMDKLVWSTAASLPHPFANASAAVCDDRLYMLGGNDKRGKSMSVFSCFLPDLTKSCQTHSSQSVPDKLQESDVWECATDVPVYRSTCVVVCGQLLAIGGRDEDFTKKLNSIYQYDSSSQSWNIIGHLSVARDWCYAAAILNGSQLLVVGGYAGLLDKTDSVEIAHTYTQIVGI